MRVLAAILLVCCAGIASNAAASPLFELTGDLTGQAGFNARSTGASAASAYFNPAQLPDAAPGVALGVFLLHDAIGISLDGRPGGDIPSSYRGATHADGSVFEQPSVPTRWLREGCQPPECPLPLPARPRQAEASSHKTRPYQAIGVVVPLVPHTLVFGFYGLVPLGKFTTAHSFFPDEREQFFTNSLHAELYSDRLTAPSLAFALGARIVRGLSLGIGSTLSLLNAASAHTFVGNPDELDRTLVLSTDVGVQLAFAPHFGVLIEPLQTLHFSATLHTVQRFDIDSGISTFLPDGNLQNVSRSTVHDYMPVRVALGVSWDVVSDGHPEPTDTHELTLSASAVLGLWSSYLDRQGARPLPDCRWQDTVSAVLAVQHSYGHVRSYLDASYVPSPVPAQTGRSNYVDNTRISAGAGIDYEFTLFDVRFRAGAQAQLHVLGERSQTKVSGGANSVHDEFPDDAVDSRGNPISAAAGLQTNNPGWPGFSSSGLLFGGGVNLAVLL
jgi:long-chain fatty acid transport protein